MKNKLIIDDIAMNKMAEQLQGQPVYADKSGNLFEPGVIDILDDEITERWQPLNENSKQLILAVEACRDIIFYFEQFIEVKTRKRAMKRMSVPICNLIDKVRQIILLSNKNIKAREHRESTWIDEDKMFYKKLSKKINKINAKSTIRRVRNKQSAHLDSDILHKSPIKFESKDILEPLGDCLIILMLSTNYPSEFFQWIRFLGESKDKLFKIVETMFSYPVSVRWITNKEGYVKEVSSVNLSADPRHEMRSEIEYLVDLYNKMIKLENCNLSEIYMIPTEELRKKTLKK